MKRFYLLIAIVLQGQILAYGLRGSLPVNFCGLRPDGDKGSLRANIGQGGFRGPGSLITHVQTH